MTITKAFLTPGNAHGRPAGINKPDKPVVHYVGGAGSPAVNVRNWFETGSGGNHVSSHYIIGLDGEILYIVPETEVASHAGHSYGKQWDAIAPTNNRTSISIEVCHPDASGKYNDASRKSLIWLLTDICTRYGWGAERIVRHYDVAGKECPLYYVNNPAEWNKIVYDVMLALKSAANTEDEEMAKRYNTVNDIRADAAVDWAADDIERLMQLGVIKGDLSGNIDLTLDMIRMSIIMGRLVGALKA